MSSESARSSTTPYIPSKLKRVVQAALERKAIGLRVLYVGDISGFTEFFLICSGTSERQVQAIADAIIRGSKEESGRPLGVEGYNHGRWVLLDFGDLVIHVFKEEIRDYYALERLWGDAADVTVASSE